jgi:hypothetical protein
LTVLFYLEMTLVCFRTTGFALTRNAVW